MTSYSSIVLLSIISINSLLLTGFHAFSTDRTLQNFLKTLKPANIALSIIAVLYSLIISGAPTPYAVFSFACLNLSFPYCFYTVVRYFPRSFTFGEALVVTQAFILIFWSAATFLPFPPSDLTKATETEIVFIFVQGGFLVALLACRLLVMAKRPWTFHFTQEFFCIWAKCCLIVLGYRLSVEDLLFLYYWVLNFFFVTTNRTILFAYCLILIVAALGVVGWKQYTANHATTAYRKYFHFLIVAVYLPGVLCDLNLLHICSVAIMYILLFVEIIRYLNLTVLNTIPLGQWIDSLVGIFRDHQDEGRLIVTPLYLLAGCSLPIWLIGLKYPSSSLSNETLAASLAGVLSIGVGDTFASIGGTMFGRIIWRGTTKSLEGTICSMVSQVAFVLVLCFSGMCSFNVLTFLSIMGAVVINALVEGMTDQIDNLILPLVTFDVILGVSFIQQLMA